MRIYKVGGAVRDRLLGLPVTENDWVVVGATPAEMSAQGYKQVGKDFPVFLHPRSGEEYALARTERKTAPGYTGFAVHAAPDVTLEEDLQRRDLTINAMAETPAGEIVDPFGGREDLQNGLLRHVSPAFVEDPVRILRVARFAARFERQGFRVAHATHALMKKMVQNGEVDALVPERVWKELERALGEASPWRFFEVLQACGALPRLFPELADLFAPLADTAHVRDKSDVPALRSLRQAARLGPDPAVRFAALCAGLDAAGLRALCGRLRVPNAYRELAELLVKHAPALLAADGAGPEDLLQLLENLDAFRRPQRFSACLTACEAVARAGGADAFAQAARLDAARQAAAGVSAQSLAARGIKGQAMRAALHALRLEAIAGALG